MDKWVKAGHQVTRKRWMPAHPAGRGQNGEQGQCLALSGSLGGVSDLSSHGVGRNPRDSFIYSNIMFEPLPYPEHQGY